MSEPHKIVSVADTPLIQVIDGNAIGFASHMGGALSVGDKPTQAIFGVIRTLRTMQVQWPRTHKLVLWDGSAKWRKELNPEYKVSRSKTPAQQKMRAEYKAQKPDIQRAIRALGIDQVWSPDCEADDLAAAYAAIFKHRKYPTMLVTADRDWLQLVNEYVTWFDPIHDRSCDLSTFTEFTGYRDGAQFLDAKCLMGDTSDNIKGVGKIGEKGAEKLLRTYGRVTRFLRLYDAQDGIEGLPKPWLEFAENLDGRRDRFFDNLKMMELKPGLPGVEKKQIDKGAFDADEFRTLCEELAFLTITNKFNDWIAPFQRVRKAA